MKEVLDPAKSTRRTFTMGKIGVETRKCMQSGLREEKKNYGHEDRI